MMVALGAYKPPGAQGSLSEGSSSMAWSSRLSRRFFSRPRQRLTWAYLTISFRLLQSRNSIGALLASHAKREWP